MHEKPRGFVSICIVIRPNRVIVLSCFAGTTSAVSWYHCVSVILFEAGARDFISHSIDLNTCCMYRDSQVV